MGNDAVNFMEIMTDNLVSRKAVMKEITKEYNKRGSEAGWPKSFGLQLAWIEKAVNSVPDATIPCRNCKYFSEPVENGPENARNGENLTYENTVKSSE